MQNRSGLKACARDECAGRCDVTNTDRSPQTLPRSQKPLRILFYQDNQLAVNIQMCEGKGTMTKNHHFLIKMELGGLSLGTHWFPGDSGTFGVFDRDFTLISTLAKKIGFGRDAVRGSPGGALDRQHGLDFARNHQMNLILHAALLLFLSSASITSKEELIPLGSRPFPDWSLDFDKKSFIPVSPGSRDGLSVEGIMSSHGVGHRDGRFFYVAQRVEVALPVVLSSVVMDASSGLQSEIEGLSC